MDSLEFNSCKGKDFPLLENNLTNSETQPMPYSGCTQGFIVRGQSGGRTKLTTYIHLVMRFKNEWSYISTAPLTFYSYL